jgi:DNA-directed RNA polymerase II subunit RPB4
MNMRVNWLSQVLSSFSIGSLCCDSAEEAKTLIPSLTDKISDDDLQELLNEITKLMGYGD